MVDLKKVGDVWKVWINARFRGVVYRIKGGWRADRWSARKQTHIFVGDVKRRREAINLLS